VTQVIPFRAQRAAANVELTKRQLADHWSVSTRWIELRVRNDGLPTVGIFAGKRRFNLAKAEDWKRRWVSLAS
jgi:hypothetical protein